jgi:DNA polymerase I-like protein with 3'-5' exonuclease and polymerase domains
LQPDGQSSEALALEHRVATICDEITEAGIPFDVEAAKQLRIRWAERRNALEAHLRAQFPEIKKLTSRVQIAKALETRGWVPDKRTEKTGQPVIDDELLETLPERFPEFTGLSEHYLLGRRLGQLSEGKKAWLRNVGPDGYIHGRMIHIGTPHSRAKHLEPNLAQVPNPKKGKPFAQECRELFRSPNGWVCVVCDQAGLQDRGFARCLSAFDNGVYAKGFSDGLDPHWAAVLALGLVPVATARDKENKVHTALREGAKRFRYAFLYGARAAKRSASSFTKPSRRPRTSIPASTCYGSRSGPVIRTRQH